MEDVSIQYILGSSLVQNFPLSSLISYGSPPLKESLSHGIYVLDRYLVYLLLGLIVQLHALLGPGHVIRKVIVVEVFPHVLQPVKEVARLPEVILQGLGETCMLGHQTMVE